MTIKTEYSYASGDLLEQPNTYFYSSFQGMDFIYAWEYSRTVCIAEFLSEENNHDKSANQEVGKEVSPTGQYLNRLIAFFDTADFPTADRRNLDALLRNFEAKKRIYEDYHLGFTSKDRTDFRQLGLYVEFAEVMVLSYRRWKELPYLNALIKCIDILCALRKNLSAVEKVRMQGLITAENIMVNQLALQLGVGKS